MLIKHLKVEIYLIDLKIKNMKCPYEQDIIWKVSRSDNIESLELAVRDEFGISDDTDVRLWTKYMSNRYEPLSKREQTVQEAGIYPGQIVVIETKNKDGSWSIGGSGNGFKVTKEQRLKYNEEKKKKKSESLMKEEAAISDVAGKSSEAQELVLCDHNGCEKAAHLYCNLCLENLCTNCAGLHLLRKSKYGHDVVEFKSKKQPGPFLYCETHADLVSELFCEQCKVPVCSKCLSSNSHKGHDFTEMFTVLNAQKECIGREKDEINIVIQKMEDFKTELGAKSEERQQKYRQLDDEVGRRGRS
ncbi:tripartite motif-containing protein 45-like [Ostrea edulis]|uniref:tripartite motif-containing protein 45-like n=1 Tax=Ostrea edulis TaxID=37623 RepID=UPI0024AFA3AC|nr:tripartite motif-containing protein 45-like [Ostrea edulis]